MHAQPSPLCFLRDRRCGLYSGADAPIPIEAGSPLRACVHLKLLNSSAAKLNWGFVDRTSESRAQKH